MHKIEFGMRVKEFMNSKTESYSCITFVFTHHFSLFILMKLSKKYGFMLFVICNNYQKLHMNTYFEATFVVVKCIIKS